MNDILYFYAAFLRCIASFLKEAVPDCRIFFKKYSFEIEVSAKKLYKYSKNCTQPFY